MRLLTLAAFSLLALTSAACNTTTSDMTSRERFDARFADYQAKRAARLAELEPKYGKCRGDGWQSVSVIGKTKSDELVNQLRACDLAGEFDTSRHVSAGGEHFFVHLGTNRTWYFVNGVLSSYRT
jgi:hypothetical protein